MSLTSRKSLSKILRATFLGLGLIIISPQHIPSSEKVLEKEFDEPEEIQSLHPTYDIRINFKDTFYDITPEELQSYMDNEPLYGGNHLFEETINDTTLRRASNHMAYVAENEPSLERLVRRLVDSTMTNEEIAQKLLDFVTNNIEYNDDDKDSTLDRLKRPNETLMTRKGDCSNMSILYASLLNQAGAISGSPTKRSVSTRPGLKWRMVYFDDHVNIVVKGDFDDNNNAAFAYDDGAYFFAETTCKGYKIGVTDLEKDLRFEDIIKIQKPGTNPNLDNPRLLLQEYYYSEEK